MTLLLLLRPIGASAATPDSPAIGGGAVFMLHTDPFKDTFRDPFGHDVFATDPFAAAAPRRKKR